MNTYDKETGVVNQEPTQSTISNITEKAKEIFQSVGEKIGLVSPQSTTEVNPDHVQVNTNEPSTYDNNTLEEPKLFMERAKVSMYEAGEKIGLVNPSDAFTIYSDSKRRVYINERGQIEEEKALIEKAKDSVYQAGEKIGLIDPESEQSFTERAKDTLYQAGERVGLIGPSEPSETPEKIEENEKKIAHEKIREEIIELRENLGLEKPEETIPEKGKNTALTEDERKPLSSPRAKEEILEACQNMGLAKPVETNPESGKVLQGNSFIKIHLPKVADPIAVRKHLPA